MNTIFDIEQKQDSPEKLAAVANIPERFYINADEFNDVTRNALQAAIENATIDFSWSNKPEHRKLNYEGVDIVQLLVMNFRSKWILDNTDEVWLLIDRYKPRRKVRQTVLGTITLNSVGTAYNTAVIDTIVELTGMSIVDADTIVGKAPYLIIESEDNRIMLNLYNELTALGAECVYVPTVLKEKNSGYKHSIYPDIKYLNRPSEILITKKLTALDFGQPGYFSVYHGVDIYNQPYTRINSIGVSNIHRRQGGQAWQHLSFRIKVKKGNKIYYSNIKAKIKMLCREESYILQSKTHISYMIE